MSEGVTRTLSRKSIPIRYSTNSVSTYVHYLVTTYSKFIPVFALAKFSGNCLLQNAHFKVVNENFAANLPKEDNKIVLNEQIRLVVEQKKVPSILKSPLMTKPPNIVIPAESTKGGKIAISPLPTVKSHSTNGYQIKVQIIIMH